MRSASTTSTPSSAPPGAIYPPRSRSPAPRLPSPARLPVLDLPDLLAAELAAGDVPDLARWAEHRGVARETASRAFTAAFGVPARRFRCELRARAAWLQIVRTRDGLAAIAAAAGFADQAHMTRHVRALTGASPARWRRDPRVLELCRVSLVRRWNAGRGER